MPHSFPRTNLDARRRGHDELSLRPEAKDFNHPEKDVNIELLLLTARRVYGEEWL